MCVCVGVTVEALCSPASSQPMETVILCLKSLLTLFDIQFPRRQLALDSNMAVELLAILHRYCGHSREVVETLKGIVK